MLIAIQIILAAAGAGAVIALAVDCAAWLKNRISKQHIVVWKDGRRWEASVCACAEKWVRKMPTVPLKDERRLILLDILRKQYRHSALQNWQLAQLISGLSAYGRDLEHAFDPQTFRITEIDDGYALYQVWKAGLADEETMLRLTAEYVDRIVSQRRKPSGLIEYRQGFGDICLVDTIAFVCPLLIRYGMRSGKRELVELAMTQIRSYYRYAYLDQYGLYAHGYHAGTGTPCESVGWGRGSGWYLLGILYCYQELADGEEKSWLKQRMIEGAENILRYEREDGGWSTQLVSKWNYDSSATAIFGVFLCHVYELDPKDRYLEAAHTALGRLMASTTKHGAIEWCEGACHGIGKYSTRYSVSPFAQGMTLELISLEKRIANSASRPH